ncbi:MAG: transcriptional regulator, family [Acidobacteriaceae bacterium]|nr:transcriptional regulator, family [Acidobacteriaceae bacterium]
MPSAKANRVTHVSRGNVFDDLGFSPEKALALKFKAKILTAILDEVRRKKYRQGQLVVLLDEHQPVVSNLLHGKISQMSIEKLLIFANRLGLALDIRRSRPSAKRSRAA